VFQVQLFSKGEKSVKLTALFTLAMGGLLVAAGTQQTLTGVITDTMCGARHAMMKGRPDADCVRMCVKGSSGYALYDGKNLWKLSDQKIPAKFPATTVKVTGVADEKSMTIKVSSIEPAQ
jgi:hypothetical protein